MATHQTSIVFTCCKSIPIFLIYMLQFLQIVLICGNEKSPSLGSSYFNGFKNRSPRSSVTTSTSPGDNNEGVQFNNNNMSSGAQCACDYGDLLTRFIQAIANEETVKRHEFRGPAGERGEPGPIGPQGIAGRPGVMGNRGYPGAQGIPGEKGEEGRPGIKGDKGERGEYIPYILEGRQYLQIKGERGEDGRPGPPGLPGIGVNGEPGPKGEPAEITPEMLEVLRGPSGPPGPVGPPGPRFNCRKCFLSRRKKSKNGENCHDDVQKVYIPVMGPPGVGHVGEPGITGAPGAPGKDLREFVIILDYEEQLDQIGDQHQVGTLVFVRSSEILFIRVHQGWKEVPLGRRISDQNSVYSQRHQRHQHQRHKRKHINDKRLTA